MDYIKIRFANEFGPADSQFGKTMETMFHALSPVFFMSERIWKPQMDIYETPEEVIILAEIAGVKKEELEIEVNSRAIKITGRRSERLPGSEARYRLAEIQYGTFERIIFLPVQIDPEVVAAVLNNGFLKIRMAKLLNEKIHRVSIMEG